MCDILSALCPCFGLFRTSGALKSVLLKKEDRFYYNDRNNYTVHKICSFGRGLSGDEEGSSPRPVHSVKIFPNQDQASYSKSKTDSVSDVTDFETLPNSPRLKKESYWSKALQKNKRSRSQCKNPASFQSLANVSMMVLPTITVARNSSPSVVESVESGHNAVSNKASVSEYEDTLRVPNAIYDRKNRWLKSQSMLDVSAEDYDNSECSDVKNVTAEKYGLDTSLYRAPRLAKSNEAVNNAWKSFEEYPDDNAYLEMPHGTIHFSAFYNQETKKLTIAIKKIEGLAPKGKDRMKYDSIVKLSLLPHSHHHAKYSKVIPAHSTLDIEEIFVFTVKSPAKKIVKISVYDSTSPRGKYDHVGQALFYVEDAIVSEQELRVMKLYRQALPDIQPIGLNISITFKPGFDIFSLSINEATNLPSYSGKYKTYIKLVQYFHGKKIREIYSSGVPTSGEVNFKFCVDVRVEPQDINNTYIVISMRVKSYVLRDETIGRLIFGPYLYGEYGQKLTPWGRAYVTHESVAYTFRMYQ